MSTPDPTYEGRRLPRPDDEVVDQGLAFDLGTLFTRRRALTFLGLGTAAVGLAACADDSSATGKTANTPSASSSPSESASATTSGDLTEIPDETAGPYPGDGSNGPDVLEQSGVVRQDIRSSFDTSTTTAEGIGMTMELTVLDMAAGGGPMVGAAVYAWHCDREGRYSMYSEGVENENYLRGVQVTDSDGVVSFTSIFPACYAGRWPHVHFEVYPDEGSIADSTSAIATSQLAFPQNVCDKVYATPGYEQSVGNLSQLSLATDGIFGDDGGAHQMATVTGDVSSGYAVRLTVPVDTTTEPTGGGMGGPP